MGGSPMALEVRVWVCAVCVCAVLVWGAGGGCGNIFGSEMSDGRATGGCVPRLSDSNHHSRECISN